MTKLIFLLISMMAGPVSAIAADSLPDKEPATALSSTSVRTASSATTGESSAGESSAVSQLKAHFKPYGFIRNYFAYDSRECVSGTGELYNFLPKDNNFVEGVDLNRQASFKFLSLTSRLGLDVVGYQVGKTHFGAKVEADFYTGLSGSSKVSGTANCRLRQAYLTLGWEDLPMSGNQTAQVELKVGQAWHPMAVDMPDIFSLSSGAPFGPFSRTPQFTMDASLGKHWIISASAIWQMQYTSTGPAGASADYIKYSCTPEMYAGISYRTGGFLARLGLDMLSIKPRIHGNRTVTETTSEGTETRNITVKVKDRLTTLSPFIYLQYKKGLFAIKAKSIFSQAGEHMNLMSGYGVSNINEDGSWDYTPLHTSSSWISLSYGKKVKGVLFAGYVQNLGTFKPLADLTQQYPGQTWMKGDEVISVEDAKNYSTVFFSKSGFANINSMVRVTPTIMYNIGKFTLGLEYEMTAVNYGEDITDIKYSANGSDYTSITRCVSSKNGLSKSGLHWVCNHRVQLMMKFSF